MTPCPTPFKMGTLDGVKFAFQKKTEAEKIK
jgi:hypothetical protein